MRCIDKTQEKNGTVYGGYLQNQDLIGQMESEHIPGDRQVSTQSRSTRLTAIRRGAYAVPHKKP